MRRLALCLGLAVAALVLFAWPLAADVPPGDTVIVQHHTSTIASGDCGVAGCKFPYLLVPHGDPLMATFFNPAFDDSSWQKGATPFLDLAGNASGYCPVIDTDGYTFWPIYGDVLIRLQLPLCVGARGVQIHVAIDNSVRVWMNGSQVADPTSCQDPSVGGVYPSHSPEGFCDFEYCVVYDRAKFVVPDWMLNTNGEPNVLAIQACDHGVVSFLDFDVVADLSQQVCEDPCEHVAVSATELWPPNHKFKPVSVTVGEGEEATLATITGVMQDEPTLAPGDKCPDATISSDGLAALLRVERLGGADGRIYHLGYEATVGGFNCTGTIGVCVPHDQGLEPNCVDGGPLYDSTVCN